MLLFLDSGQKTGLEPVPVAHSCANTHGALYTVRRPIFRVFMGSALIFVQLMALTATNVGDPTRFNAKTQKHVFEACCGLQKPAILTLLSVY